MTVELAPVTRKDMVDTIDGRRQPDWRGHRRCGAQGQGRLEAVYVKLGDRVRRGQALPRSKTASCVEQIKQAERLLRRRRRPFVSARRT